MWTGGGARAVWTAVGHSRPPRPVPPRPTLAGQQLHRGEAQSGDVVEPGRGTRPRAAEGSGQSGGGVRGEAAQVELVDGDFAGGEAERAVALPVKLG